MFCSFLESLKKLRKSSIESVEDGNSDHFDSFKQYLHIIRDVENELLNIINSTNTSNKRTLVLLCGSAGDGKSHLLSMMKNHPDKMLDNYIIHNDATESFEPNKSATQTLNDVLNDFNDTNLENNKQGKNLIVAINLGTLNNFLESEFASNFKKLFDFVGERNILNGKIGCSNFLEDSPFQSISFGDFNNYSLTSNGIEVEFIVDLINKITSDSPENIFCTEYHKVGDVCSLKNRCPVRHNYTILRNEVVQRNIAFKLVEMSIKDKYFLSTREILDFIYNIIVHPNFEDGELIKIQNDSEYLKNYIDYTLPTLLYEQVGTSNITTLISKYDHLKTRKSQIDEEIISFNVSIDIDEICLPILQPTLYTGIFTKDNLQKAIKNDNLIKTKIFKFVSRTKQLTSIPNKDYNDPYIQFVDYLYDFNAGNVDKLQNLYFMVNKSIYHWNGSLDDNYLKINKDDSISIYSSVLLNPKPVIKNKIETNSIKKFENNIIVAFEKKDSIETNVKYLRIDYALYEIIHKINAGYLPNAQDKQTFIEFDSFVTSLYDLSNAKTKVYTIDSENRKGIFELTPFGYEFKVI